MTPKNTQQQNVCFDASLSNADWPKRSWDLPAYKSPAFMRVLMAGEDWSVEEALANFRTLPVYRHAVANGYIKNDEWVEGSPCHPD